MSRQQASQRGGMRYATVIMRRQLWAIYTVTIE